ncbi:response regulator [Agaribacterium sp. ZY112]|uniref:response regulator n=1 Tax=Agaribacterium sp. ZY112 TaxID=3233574 RepID=UPI003525A785
MAGIAYHKLKVLIADDFSSFRNTVKLMLSELGVDDVEMASSAEAAIEQCERKQYDVILCDYNLGSGRNGQHVLEELRHRHLITLHSVFILVSAEAGRNIVMSAYDCTPDDYLMKPITTSMLQGRLRRQLEMRQAFLNVNRALESGNKEEASELLMEMSLDEGRHVVTAQKLLGGLFLEQGEYRKAEKLYQRVLESRELDWARLGLAKAKHLSGDSDQAGQWLEQIIEENYLFLPAYDVLSDTYLAKGDVEKAQEVVKQSVDVSPMSILRQVNLADLANKNRDREVEVGAMQRVVRLGKLSCHGSKQHKLQLARCVSEAMASDIKVSASVIKEATELLLEASDDGDHLEAAQLLYLSARLAAVKGDVDDAKEMVVEAETKLTVEDSTIDIEVDHVRALLSLDYEQKAELLLHRLQELYADDEIALQQLDEFLSEPASEASKAMVAEVNREGIELYNAGELDQALACFDKALQLFPKHVGLQLNVVQALIAKLRAVTDDDESRGKCRDALGGIATQIEDDHPQYKRFVQLKNMATSLAD